MNTTSVLQQFRQSVYQILPKRADAMVDLVDALTVAGHVAVSYTHLTLPTSDLV